MPRSAHIIRTSSFPFKDHWALWIPSTADKTIGTMIEVEGNVHSGFSHNITRNFNYVTSNRTTKFTFLSEIDDAHVGGSSTSASASASTEQQETQDTIPRNDIERHALSIPAPGPSMNSAESAPPARRSDFSDCQWWLAQVVSKLAGEGIFGMSAVDRLWETPSN